MVTPAGGGPGAGVRSTIRRDGSLLSVVTVKVGLPKKLKSGAGAAVRCNVENHVKKARDWSLFSIIYYAT